MKDWLKMSTIVVSAASSSSQLSFVHRIAESGSDCIGFLYPPLFDLFVRHQGNLPSSVSTSSMSMSISTKAGTLVTPVGRSVLTRVSKL